MKIQYEERYAAHMDDFKSYDSERIRKEFLIANVMKPGEIKLIYSHYDRIIAGGAVPLSTGLVLDTIEPLKSDYFLERREMGIINVGGRGIVIADNIEYKLEYKEAVYLGLGTKTIEFRSTDESKPAHLYINSAPAHRKYPSKKVSLDDAIKQELGNLATSNARKINKLIVKGVVETCQLQMGLTELQTGSVWNTMPPHVHSRRMEVYFYFEVPKDQAVCHFMGQPDETRHIWVKNEEAVISPNWSIHAAAGTCNYNFIWGMAGENLDYGDMDTVQPGDLR
jgi:4-deoxy-L-threo-5-hexosulose-uronate ketol-isomerase